MSVIDYIKVATNVELLPVETQMARFVSVLPGQKYQFSGDFSADFAIAPVFYTKDKKKIEPGPTFHGYKDEPPFVFEVPSDAFFMSVALVSKAVKLERVQ